MRSWSRLSLAPPWILCKQTLAASDVPVRSLLHLFGSPQESNPIQVQVHETDFDPVVELEQKPFVIFGGDSEQSLDEKLAILKADLVDLEFLVKILRDPKNASIIFMVKFRIVGCRSFKNTLCDFDIGRQKKKISVRSAEDNKITKNGYAACSLSDHGLCNPPCSHR
jgi:hypothetical protein